MKAVILAGGMGTRIVEESHLKPKPMIEIGEHPILWHIMKIYSCQGVDEFVVCLGYKSGLIKDFFLNYHFYNSDFTIDLATNSLDIHKCKPHQDIMKVTLVETGLNTSTAGRLKRVAPYLEEEDAFCMTYGDGLADIDIKALLDFHKSHGLKGTVTAVQPAGRFGLMAMHNDGRVGRFQEKPAGDGGWTNGGFFVFDRSVLDLLPENSDNLMLESHLLTKLSEEGQLMAYHHHGFWHCMDAMRDKHELESLWNSGRAPWKLWN
ncbi:glucose-1-phosphate cytidylyltransferase [Deltaproteobacteria bacterium Smac51]|nr:glucose-1-phosphate cytidylyltransferase [Deltaproteobacteria bacterium Smac51]